MADDERSGSSTRDERSGSSKGREFDRERIDELIQRSHNRTDGCCYYGGERAAIKDIKACLAEVDRLNTENAELEISEAKAWERAHSNEQRGYRRGLEEGKQELWDYFHRQPEDVIPGLEDYMDAIQALMDMPQEEGNA
jgi:hypothetical protein